MKKFDIDNILKNLSTEDVERINKTYNDQTNKEESFNEWFLIHLYLIASCLKDCLFQVL